MSNSTPLSPAANAVLDAAYNAYTPTTPPSTCRCVAAALRAAADHIWHWDGAESVEHLKVIAAELEACCEALARELICDGKHVATDLRSVRRPKPPSLAEEALKALKRQAVRSVPSLIATEDCDTIRCALERLQELENND